jgi:hypothetical protein
MKSVFFSILLSLLVFHPACLQAVDVTIIDSRHYSNVFGEIRNYRIFLPPGYYDSPPKRYPVIYFYHGWLERYFGITRNGGYDTGDENNGDNIANYGLYEVEIEAADIYGDMEVVKEPRVFVLH